VHEHGPFHDDAVAALRAKYLQYTAASFAAVLAVEPAVWTGWSAT
jgi:hypothetical protein